MRSHHTPQTHNQQGNMEHVENTYTFKNRALQRVYETSKQKIDVFVEFRDNVINDIKELTKLLRYIDCPYLASIDIELSDEIYGDDCILVISWGGHEIYSRFLIGNENVPQGMDPKEKAKIQLLIDDDIIIQMHAWPYLGMLLDKIINRMGLSRRNEQKAGLESASRVGSST